MIRSASEKLELKKYLAYHSQFCKNEKWPCAVTPALQRRDIDEILQTTWLSVVPWVS